MGLLVISVIIFIIGLMFQMPLLLFLGLGLPVVVFGFKFLSSTYDLAENMIGKLLGFIFIEIPSQLWKGVVGQSGESEQELEEKRLQEHLKSMEDATD